MGVSASVQGTRYKHAQCGNPRDAIIVSDRLCEMSVVPWNAFIAGYAQQEGTSQDALVCTAPSGTKALCSERRNLVVPAQDMSKYGSISLWEGKAVACADATAWCSI